LGKKAKQRARQPVWRRFSALIVAVVGIGATILLYRNLRQYDFGDVATSVMSITYSQLGVAFAWAMASYLCLTGFDYLALRYVEKPRAYPFVAFVSFVSLSIGHNLGVAFLSSGAIRYRFYSRAGLSAEDVGKVILFCGATVALGLATLAGVALILRSEVATEILALPASAVILIASACLAVPAVYVVLAFLVRQPLRVRTLSVQMPKWWLALGQVGIGTLNFACVAGCLYAAINAFTDVPYFAVAAVYTIANVAGLISHVPGGLGIIEGVVLYLLPGASLIGAVLVFRFVYFLVPLALGGLLFSLSEIWMAGRRAHTGG
jgi:uncharacterized membrane protein YbhN (UPF0104 family)